MRPRQSAGKAAARLTGHCSAALPLCDAYRPVLVPIPLFTRLARTLAACPAWRSPPVLPAVPPPTLGQEAP